MTLKDIAAKAGVHVSTVSRILASPDDSFGSREVRERVWAIVKDTGYVPNAAARSLRQKNAPPQVCQNGTLVCILGRAKTVDDNPFFGAVARAAEQQALLLGYAVSVSISIADATEIKRSKDKPIGAIVLGRFEKQETAKVLESLYGNIVFVGRSAVGQEWDQVICDGYEASKIALRHLLAFGHRRIGYIGEAGSEIRYRAYLDILREQGIHPEKKWAAACPHNSAEGGYGGADALLRQADGDLPTAVFCASDVAAIAAMRRFKEEKIRIPERVSIVSLDNIELSGYVTPMLSTVGMPMEEMGKVAVQTLVSRIKKLHRLPLKIHLQGKLARRESVLNLNKGECA
ncbi:MAG: LacI family transcriptional regulator [Oscillospiraceae bacterium]|jgi:DNA-binding LacI/PurR family transcriptional regulator|nr:LacI family transcriptional regulator [Oscillospiraceae bacterium]